MAISKSFKRTEKEYEIYGTVVKLRVPLFTRLEQFEVKMKEVQKDPTQSKLIVFEFLSEIGLTKEVFEQMELDHIFELIDDLCGKKNNSGEIVIA